MNKKITKNTTKKAAKLQAGQQAQTFQAAFQSIGQLVNLYADLDNPPDQGQPQINNPPNMQAQGVKPTTANNKIVGQKGSAESQQLSTTQNQNKTNQSYNISIQQSQQSQLKFEKPQEETKSVINQQPPNQNPKLIIERKTCNVDKNQLLISLKKITNNKQFISDVEQEQNQVFLDHFYLLSQQLFNDNEDLLLFFEDAENQAPTKKVQVEEIIKNCQTAKTNFQDPDFTQQLPDEKSMRSLQIMENPQLFTNISPFSILQGSLGDCYLLSSISVLAENPFYITRLFEPKKMNEQGAYAIWICESGFWKQILVDDYFLVDQFLSPIYCKSKQNELWPLLLEKAYAKCYGGYSKIVIGYSVDALRDLTGAPSAYIDIQDEQKACEQIKNALEKKFVLTASSKENSEDMISKHCYAILGYKQVKNSANQTLNLLKIRNPYGSIGEVKQTVDQTAIQNLGEQLKQDGGILWLEMKEFQQNFEVVSCNFVHNGYSNSTVTSTHPAEFFYVRVHKSTHAYFSIIQKHKRFFKNSKSDIYYYPTQRIILSKINEDGTLTCLGGDFNCRQACYIEQNLERGEYLLYTETDFQQKNNNNNQQKQQQEQQNQREIYCVDSYAQYPVSLTPYSNKLKQLNMKNTIQSLMKQYMVAHSDQFNQKLYSGNDNQLIQRLYGDIYGYVIILYLNYSKDQQLYETISEFILIENLIPCDAELKSGLKINLQPGQEKFLMFKIGNLNNSSHKLSFQSSSNVTKAYIGQVSGNLSEDSNMDALIQQTIAQGDCKKRTNGNREINIQIYTLKYNEGFCMVYKNCTKGVYKETLQFTVLDNLVISSQGQVRNKEVSVIVQPGETFWVNLGLRDLSNKSSKYQMKYLYHI